MARRITNSFYINPPTLIPKIGIIGFGNMGRRIARGLVRSGIPQSRIQATIKEGDSMKLEREDPRIRVHHSNPCLVLDCSTIFIAVKANDVKSVGDSIKDVIPYYANHTDKLIISTAAGVKLEHLDRWIPRGTNIRCIPNLPIETGSGSVAWFTNNIKIKEEIKSIVKPYFRTSANLWLEKEEAIEAATVVSGCAPAYISYYFRSMIDGAIKLGLSEEEAMYLLRSTFMGTSALLTHQSPNKLIDLTASKGGATEKAIRIFDQCQVNQIIFQVQSSALDRINQISVSLNETDLAKKEFKTDLAETESDSDIPEYPPP